MGGYFVGSDIYSALDYFTSIEPKSWKYVLSVSGCFINYGAGFLMILLLQTKSSKMNSSGDMGNCPSSSRGFVTCSSTQLRLASLYDCGWDFTLYGEGFMALQGDSTKYISVNRLISQPPLDPDYVSVKDYVEVLSKGGTFEENKVTPPELAGLLRNDCSRALQLVEAINTSGNTSLMYEVADVKAWAYLGLHLAEKLEGAVALQTFRKQEVRNREKAITHLGA